MNRPLASVDARDPRGGYVVRKPRASDALSCSLLGIYEADYGLPADIAALVHRLDKVSSR